MMTRNCAKKKTHNGKDILLGKMFLLTDGRRMEILLTKEQCQHTKANGDILKLVKEQ